MKLHLFVAATFALLQAGAADTPQSAFNRLIETDRAFSAAAPGKPPLEAVSAMFADDVIVPGPSGAFLQGKDKALEVMKANPDNLTGKFEWSPIGGGISADGLHGFTFGYMTMTKPDGSVVPLKYLAYWIKGADGWRVAAYRRRRRPEGPVDTAMLPPALPARLVPPSTDSAAIAKHGESLAAAEKAFSDEAQKIGVGPAFAKHGRPDAVNMGGPKDAGFVVSAQAIGRNIGEGQPTDRAEIEWSADRVLVASTGDLGITFGTIRPHKPQPGQPAGSLFYTIWRRDPSQPWRYIAE